MPTPTTETVLTAIPGLSEEERLLLVLCHYSGGSHMELRQQSWGIGVGWFTQSSVRLAPHQVAELRNSLGVSSAGRGRVATSVPTEYNRLRLGESRGHDSYPRVVRADSA